MIILKAYENKVKFSKVNTTGVFTHNGQTYFKTSAADQGINLMTGDTAYFENNDMVVWHKNSELYLKD